MEEPAGGFIRQPVGRFEWERTIRRAVIKPSSVKFLGLMMATFASADGSRVRPGRERLAAVMGTSLSVVDRGQKSLEELGFLDKVYKGHGAGRGRSGGFASEFQLSIPSDLLERIQMIDMDGSHSSGELSGSDSQSSSETSGMEEPLINFEEPLSNLEEPLVNPGEPLSSSDRPPDHFHHYIDQNKKHQSKPVASGNAHARDGNGLTDPFLDDSQAYANASAYLQRLPDLGLEQMKIVSASHPEMSLRERVITAAAKAGWTAIRKAS